MVKIKESYVMSPREKAEFDRLNALPRKVSGRVDYCFKPQTKYPPRIYVYMHAETWCDRNRRPMGLFYAVPFLSRPMNKEEIEYHHFDIRLCYHQYEDWVKLIYAEEQEAEELEREQPGIGTAFLEKLKSYQGFYTIGKKESLLLVAKQQQPESEESRLIRELIQNGHRYNAKEIGEKLKREQNEEKRLPILILLRELYKNTASGQPGEIRLTPEAVERKAFISQERTRKNFVRRVFKRNKLFAMEEIRCKYCDYNEEMLYADLTVHHKKPKRKKCKPITDLRRCQLEKLADRLKTFNINDKDYHNTCCRMVMLQNAHNHRLPIPLTVTLNKETLIYSFHWRTRESVVKSFVDLANAKDMTHLVLGQRYKDITGSSYSY
ncbi:MAG: hypothetical protein JWR09_753 [Mucilaginibacter sp.]|nr:hypothetical protein [Mucilaginibacter sp.]